MWTAPPDSWIGGSHTQRMSAPTWVPGGLPRKTHAGLQAGACIVAEYAPTRLMPRERPSVMAAGDGVPPSFWSTDRPRQAPVPSSCGRTTRTAGRPASSGNSASWSWTTTATSSSSTRRIACVVALELLRSSGHPPDRFAPFPNDREGAPRPSRPRGRSRQSQALAGGQVKPPFDRLGLVDALSNTTPAARQPSAGNLQERLSG